VAWWGLIIKKENILRNVRLFMRFYLPLQKVGCTSAMKIKGHFSTFYFALRSVCTTFAEIFIFRCYNTRSIF